jgi:hypothetical protein
VTGTCEAQKVIDRRAGTFDFSPRCRAAGGQDYEVRYEAKKIGTSKSAVKKAVKKVGDSRRKIEKRLGR